MPVIFWNGKVLFRQAFGTGPAMDLACCCNACCGCVDLTGIGDAEDIPLTIKITGDLTYTGKMERINGTCDWEKVFTAPDTITIVDTDHCDEAPDKITLLCCGNTYNDYRDFRLHFEVGGLCTDEGTPGECDGLVPDSGTCDIDNDTLSLTFNVTMVCESGNCVFTVKITRP